MWPGGCGAAGGSDYWLQATKDRILGNENTNAHWPFQMALIYSATARFSQEYQKPVLGWSWLIPPHEWKYDVTATELVRAIAFDGECLRGKCDSDPVLGYALLTRFSQVLVGRLQATRFRLLDIYGTDAN